MFSKKQLLSGLVSGGQFGSISQHQYYIMYLWNKWNLICWILFIRNEMFDFVNPVNVIDADHRNRCKNATSNFFFATVVCHSVVYGSLMKAAQSFLSFSVAVSRPFRSFIGGQMKWRRFSHDTFFRHSKIYKKSHGLICHWWCDSDLVWTLNLNTLIKYFIDGLINLFNS